MPMITSTSNAQVKRVRQLQRDARERAASGLCVVEGLRLAREATLSQAQIEAAYITAQFRAQSAGAELERLLQQRGAPLTEVTPAVMQAMADTETPQGILLVLSLPPLPFPERGFFFIPDGVRDPGNLGTMLRTAWAAGVEAVCLPPGTVDPTNPKVLRAGMGAHFHLPLLRLDWEALHTLLAGAPVWLAEAQGAVPYSEVDWRGEKAGLIVGGEAFGAGLEARRLAAGRHVRIPMAPGVESLNAASAAAILLFAAARQRHPRWH